MVKATGWEILFIYLFIYYLMYLKQSLLHIGKKQFFFFKFTKMGTKPNNKQTRPLLAERGGKNGLGEAPARNQSKSKTCLFVSAFPSLPNE